jgi:hypothetical protein
LVSNLNLNSNTIALAKDLLVDAKSIIPHLKILSSQVKEVTGGSIGLADHLDYSDPLSIRDGAHLIRLSQDLAGVGGLTPRLQAHIDTAGTGGAIPLVLAKALLPVAASAISSVLAGPATKFLKRKLGIGSGLDW